MKKKKENSGGNAGPKTKQVKMSTNISNIIILDLQTKNIPTNLNIIIKGVPIMLGDEFANDNREEHDSLIATQNGGNTAQYNVSIIVSFKSFYKLLFVWLQNQANSVFAVELGGYSLYLGKFITGPAPAAPAARGRKTAL